MAATPSKTGDQPKRAPTLYIIVLFDLIKGSLLLLTALGIFALSGHNLNAVFDQVLRWVHLDPEHIFFVRIGKSLETITPANLRLAELGTLVCGLLRLGVGVGLAFRARWAVWLAIGESAFFIPIEIHGLLRRYTEEAAGHHRAEMFRHPELGILGIFLVLVVNVVIVWYLFANRNRLFRHHHQ
jgi:uncharacterized membrane protein (DUF2068 family)